MDAADLALGLGLAVTTLVLGLWLAVPLSHWDWPLSGCVLGWWLRNAQPLPSLMLHFIQRSNGGRRAAS